MCGGGEAIYTLNCPEDSDVKQQFHLRGFEINFELKQMAPNKLISIDLVKSDC